MSAPGQMPPAGPPHSGRQLLDATIDPLLAGTTYVEQIAQLYINIPATRSWKEGQKWPHQSIPQDIMDYSHDTTGPMLVNVGLFGKFEVKRFWEDLETIVARIWGCWDKMHAARHTRQWDIDEMRTALAGHLWSLWQEPAGFPDDPAMKKWFRGFVIYRYKNTRRARGRQRSTSPKPVKQPKSNVRKGKVRMPPTFPRFHVPHLRVPFGPPNAPAAPQRQHPYAKRPPNALAALQRQNGVPNGPSRAPASTHIHTPQAFGTGPSAAPLDNTTSLAQGLHLPQIRSEVALDVTGSENGSENLHPLGTMTIVVSWASEWNGSEANSTNNGPAYSLTLTRLGITSLDNNFLVDPDRAAEVIAQALQCQPVNWDPRHEFLILLDSRGGLHYAINGATAMSKGKILEALREERRRNQRDLKMKIVKRSPDFDRDIVDEGILAAGETHEPKATSMMPFDAHEGQRDGLDSRPPSDHTETGPVKMTVPLGFMNIIVSRSSEWNGDGFPPDDHQSYATTLNSLGVQGTDNTFPADANAVLRWLKSDPVKWDPQQELITLLGSKKGASSCFDEQGTGKILNALLEERSRNESSLKMKIVPRLYDLGSASEDELMHIGEDGVFE